jgi:hypothetical protein
MMITLDMLFLLKTRKSKLKKLFKEKYKIEARKVDDSEQVNFNLKSFNLVNQAYFNAILGIINLYFIGGANETIF